MINDVMMEGGHDYHAAKFGLKATKFRSVKRAREFLEDVYPATGLMMHGFVAMGEDLCFVCMGTRDMHVTGDQPALVMTKSMQLSKKYKE